MFKKKDYSRIANKSQAILLFSFVLFCDKL